MTCSAGRTSRRVAALGLADLAILTGYPMTPATLRCTTHGPLPTALHSSITPAGPHTWYWARPLAGAEDLPGAREVEGMDLPGVPVSRHWPPGSSRISSAAVSGEAQRAERLARAWSGSTAAVGVQRRPPGDEQPLSDPQFGQPVGRQSHHRALGGCQALPAELRPLARAPGCRAGHWRGSAPR